MADGHLLHAGHAAQEVAQVGPAQVVPGVDAETRSLGRAGRRGKLRHHLGLARGAPGNRIGFGVQLDAVGTNRLGQGHGGGVSVHEQADPHAQGTGLGNQRAQAIGMAGGGRQVPAMVAGGLAFAVGHKGALVRPHGTHEVHQVLGGVALDVELAVGPGLHECGEVGDVMGADMALVGPGVDGDAGGTGLQADFRRAGDAGVAQITPVAHLGHEVDVDGQRGGGVHGRAQSFCRSTIIWRVRRLETPQW